VQQNDLLNISLDLLMQLVKEKINDKFDMVVAIGRGGILPGYLAARYLDIPLEIITLHFRDDFHKIELPEPQLQSKINFEVDNKKILLFDDVSNSGKTIEKAKKMLPNCKSITTAVISGNADISLTGAHDRCIKWPWND